MVHFCIPLRRFAVTNAQKHFITFPGGGKCPSLHFAHACGRPCFSCYSCRSAQGSPSDSFYHVLFWDQNDLRHIRVINRENGNVQLQDASYNVRATLHDRSRSFHSRKRMNRSGSLHQTRTKNQRLDRSDHCDHVSEHTHCAH